MPEPLPSADYVWNRTKWQEQRKKNGDVPKGACLKVSVGDALDKFHNEAKKGLAQGKKAADDLQKLLVTYKAAIKTKYKAFHDLIDKFLVTKIKSYLEQVKQIQDGVSEYAKLRTAASEQMLVVGAELMKWEKGPKTAKFKPSNDKAAEKSLTAFLTSLQKMVYATDKITSPKRVAFDKPVFRITAGDWDKDAIADIIKQLKDFPGSV